MLADPTLDRELFNALLDWLHPERDEAGRIYEQLRARLIGFFQYQGCPEPEEYTDITIERVARKIAEGTEVRSKEPYAYCRGVARNVMLEFWKRRERRPAPLEELTSARQPAVDPHESERQREERNRRERMLECLEQCLNSLPAEQRALFIEYNREEKRERINNRTALADKFGIDITALRNRIARLREKLEKCVRDCASR